MNRVSFRKVGKRLLSFSATLILAAAVVASGLFIKPLSTNAATNELFTARTLGTNLTGNSYSVTGTPSITVLTHGLGGSASHWSNAGGYELSYDDRSLIEQLRQASGGRVFKAEMQNNGTSFYLSELSDRDSNGQTLARFATYRDLGTVSQLTYDDISQHMIIVFEAYTPSGSNAAVYGGFKTMLLDIVQDYGYMTGGVYPRINLIGHSRGGLTNMDFANEFPRLIDSMFALGTPFFGSNFGRVNLFAYMTGDYGTAGLTDINEPIEQNRLKNAWNANRANGKGSHINFYTMSGQSTLGMIIDTVGGVWGTIASTIVTIPIGGPVFPILVSAVSPIIWGAEALVPGLPTTPLLTINDAFYDAFSGSAFLWVDNNTIINDDILVHRSSAEAIGYNGIADSYLKTFRHNGLFSTKNFDESLTSVPAFAIVHNLETRDDDFIGWIMSKINTDVSVFSTSPTSPTGTIVIPASLNGGTVTIIAETPAGYAFTSWTVNSGGSNSLLASPSSAITTLPMPNNNVTVTASWKPTVTVNGGYNNQWTPSGAGSYAPGATVTINAGSSQGKIFNGWTINSGTLSLQPNSNSVIATFTMPNTPVTVTANWLNGYDVSVSGSYANTTGAGSYTQGSTVSINAGTRYGFVFNGWDVISGNVSLANNKNASTTFNMPSGNVSIEATWIVDGSSWAAYGSSQLYPYFSGAEWCVPYDLYLGGDSYGGFAYFEYSWDAYNFREEMWNGVQYLTTWTDSGTQYSLYYCVHYEVDYCGNGPYYVTVSGSYANPTGANYYYPEGTINIYAGTRSGYVFSGWTVNSGNVSLNNPNSATTYFTMPNSAVSLTANWAPVSSTYSVTVNGSNASPTGAGSYAPSSTVTIYAGTKSGYIFNGWSTSSSGVSFNNSKDATTTFNMPTNAVTVTANWVLPSYSVSVSGSYADYSGYGSYTQNSTVDIYAGVRQGYKFNGWTVNSGSVSLDNPNSPTTSFTMPAGNVSVTANWAAPTTWQEYGEYNFHPYAEDCLYRVPYELQYYKNGFASHNTYAYFDNPSDACYLADSWWWQSMDYIGSYDGGDLYYCLEWMVEYYDNGEWHSYWKK